MDFGIERLSEDALLLRFGDRVDPAINACVHAAARALRQAKLPGVIDIAPAYATLLLRFEPSRAGMESDSPALASRLHRIFEAQVESGPISGSRRLVDIPVCYGGEFGPDLEAVAAHAGLSREDAIRRHTAAQYTVAMLGFAPGFPYLLGLDPALHMPRRSDPRTRVPAGSVAIGGAQTGIYPRDLPGGWQLIGRTPLVLFDPRREPPCLFAPGDRVCLRAIGTDGFARLAAGAP